MNYHNKTFILSKTNIKNNNKREDSSVNEIPTDSAERELAIQPASLTEKAPEDHLFVSDRIPKQFTDLVKYFFPTAKAIEEFWRMTMISAYRHNYENEADTLLTVSLHSFKQLVRKLKSSATVKNPIAYFTGILNKKFQEVYFGEQFLRWGWLSVFDYKS